MIFKVQNDQLSIFGKTLDDVRNKLININEIWMQGGRFGKNQQALIPENKLINVLSTQEASDIVNNLNTIKDKTNETYMD